MAITDVPTVSSCGTGSIGPSLVNACFQKTSPVPTRRNTVCAISCSRNLTIRRLPALALAPDRGISALARALYAMVQINLQIPPSTKRLSPR